jgi:Protein of unknown function with HXXEE motif
VIWSKWDLGWPWLCLGGGLVLFAVMFFSDFGRSNTAVSRWRDPVWLAWLPVPMLMVHMFEEYGFDILGRTYALPALICNAIGYQPYPNCPIPIPHYPLLNLGVAWVTAPIAAVIARRNLVIGLSFYGLTIVNGLAHVGMTLAVGLEMGTGVLTGGLFFIASFFWMIYAVRRSGVMSGKALWLSISGGVISHAMIPPVFFGYRAGLFGAAGVYILDVVMAATPILIGWMWSKVLGPVSVNAPRAAAA